jgi:hypothetical protein
VDHKDAFPLFFLQSGLRLRFLPWLSSTGTQHTAPEEHPRIPDRITWWAVRAVSQSRSQTGEWNEGYGNTFFTCVWHESLLSMCPAFCGRQRNGHQRCSHPSLTAMVTSHGKKELGVPVTYLDTALHHPVPEQSCLRGKLEGRSARTERCCRRNACWPLLTRDDHEPRCAAPLEAGEAGSGFFSDFGALRPTDESGPQN